MLIGSGVLLALFSALSPNGSDLIAAPAAREKPRCGVLLPVTTPPGYDLAPAPPPEIPLPEQIPAAARPALQRLRAAPETVALVAFRVGEETRGLYWNADVPMPLASVVKIVHLYAYARAVVAGELDPDEAIPLEDIAAYYLPNSDGNAHLAALADLRAAGFITGTPETVALKHLPTMMIEWSSNAATDYLHMRLGQPQIEQAIDDLGWHHHTAPCPFVGQFLLMGDPTGSASDVDAVQEWIDHPEDYAHAVMEITGAYSTDPLFRAAQINRQAQRSRPALAAQHLFADHLATQGSPREYAGLLARLAIDSLSNPEVNALMRDALEWIMVYRGNQARFRVAGYKGGALPGVLTAAYYAVPREGGAPLVVVLFYRRLPPPLFEAWQHERPHDNLALWLLSDPTAIDVLREFLHR